MNKTLLRIHVFDNRAYRELDNGPFAIDESKLMEARRRFMAEREKAGRLEGANIAPQTAARDILKDIAPELSDFDRLMLGFAVTNDRIKIERIATS